MKFSFVLFCCFTGFFSFAQNAEPWHGIQRKVHYKPDGEDFLLVKGSKRFNRALYGGHTAFRVEAGDLPEFALYLPGMGGNLKFGLIKNDQSKWLIDADSIETRYRAGSMVYRIKDRLLGKATLVLTVLSLFDKEGLIVKLEANEVADNVQLIVAYGGVSGQKFSRDGDVGADPESSFYLKPEYCTDNVYSINKNQFTVFLEAKTVNGEVVVEYQDNTSDTLSLKNPENWCPIEQDYYEDGYAFPTGAVRPVRYLKTGEDSRDFKNFITIRGFSNRGIDGGAATVVDLPLDPSKELKSLHLKAIANDVVIGLMSVTLVR